MISRSNAEAVLAEALKTGGDFAELYMEDAESHSIAMLQGVVENAAYSRKKGAGVRVLSGTKSAYAYTVDTSLEALLDTARRASAIISGEGTEIRHLTDIRQSRGQYRIPFSTIDNAKRIELLLEGTNAAKGVSDEINRVS
ncbi:MAG: TldD/PmbA family protein, partial [Clostridia bacterium]|nr:TldD/PmbA family protein [Clostridia bacterium]